MKKKRSKRVMSVLMALLMIVGLLPTNLATMNAKAALTFGEGTTKVADGAFAGWEWRVFGNSTNTTDNTISEDNGKITLVSGGGKGKIASSNDGINYFYYELNTDKDFILSTHAKITAVSKGNQVAFGVMLRDAVGTHGSTAEASPLSSLLIGACHNTVDGAVVGLYGSDRKNAGSRVDLKATDFSSAYNGCIDDMTSVGGEYDITMQKVGTKVYLWLDGNLIERNVSDYIGSADDKMYVGLTTVRNITVEYTNISLDVATAGSTVVISDVAYPTKNEYTKGNNIDDIDLTGFSATATVNGEAKTITANNCRIVTTSFPTAGAVNLVLDYFGQTIDLPVTVISEDISEFTMKYAPVKTDYYVGEAFDWTGFDAPITYTSGVETSAQKLIADKSTEIVIEVDGVVTTDMDTVTAAAGTKTVTITHNHGTTEAISFDIVVSGAAVDSLTLAGPNQKTFYKGISVDADAYKKGLLVTANYDDGSKQVMSNDNGYTVTAKADALDVNTVGSYVYVVECGGKTAEYTLTVVDKNVSGIEISQYPTTTTFVKEASFDATGLEVKVVYDSGEKVVLNSDEYTIDFSAYNKSAVGEYTVILTHIASGKTASFIAAVREKVNFTYDDLDWASIVFGQSIDKGNVPSVSNGVITVEQGEGKGKCTDDAQDGIAYYYTVLDPAKDNFEITATVQVDYFITKASADNQEGFGIMVRDSIGPDKDSSIYYSNAMSVGGYYGTFNVFGRYGVSSSSDGAGRENYTLHGKGKTDKVLAAAPRTFVLTLKKDNTGVYATMTENGSVVSGIDGKTTWYLPADTFGKIEDDKMYVGFMAARGAKIEVDTSTIAMKITASAADAPQTFAAAKAVNPTVSVASLVQTADEDYNFKATVNTKGLLTVKQNGATVVKQQVVEAGTYTFPVKLLVGSNAFQLYFEPDATQNITSADAKIVNATVTRKIYEATKLPIYAGVNGTKTAAGTKADPLDLQSAITYCQQGQAVYVLEGTYKYTSTVGIFKGNNGGGEESRKQLIACPDNTGDVIIDLAVNNAASSVIFDMSGDYWYVKGIKIGNGGGVTLGGSHNVLEQCDFFGHTNSGLSISRTDGAETIDLWPSYNTILNCNAYSNRDKSDNNADGFAAKLTCGVGNVFKGCVAAYNADDGWDLFSKGATGAIGVVKIYDSICYGNGFAIGADGKVTTTKGDGNGFKMGGSGIAVQHEIYNSYAFGNAANGFTNNSDPMGAYYDCVGYNNGGANLELHIYTGATPDFIVENFLSFADNTYTSVSGLSATVSEATAVCINPLRSDDNFFYNAKTGISSNASGVELTADNFASLAEFASYVNGTVKIPRKSNGDIALGDFLKYVATPADPVTPVTPVTPVNPSDSGNSDNTNNNNNSNNTSGTTNTTETAKTTTTTKKNTGKTTGNTSKSTDIVADNSVKPEKAIISVVSPANNKGAGVADVKLASGTVFKNAEGVVVPADSVKMYVEKEGAFYEEQVTRINDALTKNSISLPEGSVMEVVEAYFTGANGGKLNCDGTVTVAFSLPEGTSTDTHTFTIYHLTDEGVLETFAPDLKSGNLEVNVKSFSPFAIVAEVKAAEVVTDPVVVDKEKDTTESSAPVVEKSSNNTVIYIVIIAIILLAGGAGIVYMLKKRRDEEI